MGQDGRPNKIDDKISQSHLRTPVLLLQVVGSLTALLVCFVGLLATGATPLQAQCPVGYALVVNEPFLYYNGVTCCSLQVTYCKKFGTNSLEIIIQEVKLLDDTQSSCWGLNPTTPALFNSLRRSIIAKEIANLPLCPTTAPIQIEDSYRSCTRQVRQVLGTPPNQYLQISLVSCSDNYWCRRICYACKSGTETDPCTDLPRIELTNCQWIESTNCPITDPVIPGDCANVCGS